jgi:hypothetical protein
VSTPESESAPAGVLAQRHAERGRLDPTLEHGDPFVLSLRFAMDGILKRLHELLQVLDPRLQRLERGRVIFDGNLPPPRGRRFGRAANLPDPRDQPLALVRTHFVAAR